MNTLDVYLEIMTDAQRDEFDAVVAMVPEMAWASIASTLLTGGPRLDALRGLSGERFADRVENDDGG